MLVEDGCWWRVGAGGGWCWLDGGACWMLVRAGGLGVLDDGAYGTDGVGGTTTGSTGGTVRSHSIPQHLTFEQREPSICFITSARALAQMVIKPPSAMYSSVLI